MEQAKIVDSLKAKQQFTIMEHVLSSPRVEYSHTIEQK